MNFDYLSTDYTSDDERPPASGTAPEPLHVLSGGNAISILKRHADSLGQIRNPVEEKRLLRRYREQADLDARERLLAANLRFALSRARKFPHFTIAEDTMAAEAVMGLIHALNRFDLAQDVRISTYAAHIIDGHLKDFICRYYELPKSAAYEGIFLTLNAQTGRYRSLHGNIPQHDMDRVLLNHYRQRITSETVTLNHIHYVRKKISEIYTSLNEPVLNPSSYMDPDAHAERIDMIPSEWSGPQDLVEEEQEDQKRRSFLERTMAQMSELQRRFVEVVYLNPDGIERTNIEAHEILGIGLREASELRTQTMKIFRNAADHTDMDSFDYKRTYLPPPADPDPYFHSDMMMDIYRSIRRTLSPSEFFIASCVFFTQPDEIIAIDDIAEALHITADSARKSLSQAAYELVHAVNRTEMPASFIPMVQDCLRRTKALDMHLDEKISATADIRRPSDIVTYHAAWHYMNAEDRYIIAASRLCDPRERRTAAHIAQDIGISEDEVVKSINTLRIDLYQTVRGYKSKYINLADSSQKHAFLDAGPSVTDRLYTETEAPSLPIEQLGLDTPERKKIFDFVTQSYPAHQAYFYIMTKMAPACIARTADQLSDILQLSGNTILSHSRTIDAAVGKISQAHLTQEEKEKLRRDKFNRIGMARKASDRLNVPDIDESLIDLSNPATARDYQAAREILAKYQLFVFCATTLYRPESRLTHKQVASILTEQNPEWQTMNPENVTVRIRTLMTNMRKKIQQPGTPQP